MDSLWIIAWCGISLIVSLIIHIKNRKDLISCAQLFDPNIKKYMDAERLIRQKYEAAKKYGYHGSRLDQVLAVLYANEPHTFAGYKDSQKTFARTFTQDGNTVGQVNLLEVPGMRETFKQAIENSKQRTKDIRSGKLTYPQGYTPPTFKYMKDPIRSGMVDVLDKNQPCACCKKPTNVAVELEFGDDYEHVCLFCIKDGNYHKVTNQSINDKDNIIPSDKKVSNPQFNFEFENCTPSFASWQDNYWLTHCDDYCEFISQVYWDDIVKLGDHVVGQVITDYLNQNNGLNISVEQLKEQLVEDGPIAGYLFRCVGCHTYRLLVELA